MRAAPWPAIPSLEDAKDQEQHAQEQSSATEQTATAKPTVRDIYMKKIAENSGRWKEAPITGQGVGIGGVTR